MLGLIYNSRNSKDLIVKKIVQIFVWIYNSRNSKDLIVAKKPTQKLFYLQQ